MNSLVNYDFIYHCGESYDAGFHHLKSWIPFFISNEFNFLLILRNVDIYKWACEEYPLSNIALARKNINIEEVLKIINSKNLVLYSSASINNGQLIRFNHLKHVFIGHGDSEKAGSAHKGHRWFDEIWTAGQAHIDRYKNTGVNFSGVKFVKVGRPNLKKIINFSNSIDAENNFSNRVLYLPTWEGVFDSNNYSSVKISNNILDVITSLDISNAAVKFHPYTGGRLKIYADVEKKLLPLMNGVKQLEILSRTNDLLNFINFYNFFVCDISSVVSECLPLNRPIFLYMPKDVQIDIAVSDMPYEKYCYIFSSAEELKELMQKVLGGDDYLSEERSKAIDYFIGVEETLGDEFVKQIKSV